MKQALASATERLTNAGIENARKDAELLLVFVLDRERTYLYSHPEYSLNEEEASRYRAAIDQRCLGMPPQYITGHQEFWGMDFLVSPAVLIPRPETEHLVETVLQLTRNLERPRIVDVGTGSGCIALALAKELPQAEIYAVDISPAALEVARSNAVRNLLKERVCFEESNFLGAFRQSVARFDFVVSNPPYVSEGDKEALQPEVRDFEPHLALFAGANGLDMIERLIPQAQHTLKAGGWLVMEIGKGQEEYLRERLAKWNNVRFTNDLKQIPRVVAAQKRPVELR
jgi:release factor glutamine methyltransferase